ACGIADVTFHAKREHASAENSGLRCHWKWTRGRADLKPRFDRLALLAAFRQRLHFWRAGRSKNRWTLEHSSVQRFTSFSPVYRQYQRSGNDVRHRIGK